MTPFAEWVSRQMASRGPGLKHDTICPVRPLYPDDII